MGDQTLRKVVDSNFLRSPELRRFLSTSPRNLALLTDYSAMEAYKGNTLVSIFESMAILSEFPKQVVVLKGTTAACGLRGRSAGMAKRLTDHHQTAGFGTFCSDLVRARAGYEPYRRTILAHGREASSQMDRVQGDALDLPSTFTDLAAGYSQAELTEIRTSDVRDIQSRALIAKILEGIFDLFMSMFKRHPRATFVPARLEVPNLFILRTALCAYVLFLRWVAEGRQKNIRPERVRNDLVDLNFAAFASYFDGILTADKKLIKIYDQANWILDRIVVASRQPGKKPDGPH